MERELRIYIAEDDIGVIDTLRDFIEDQGLAAMRCRLRRCSRI